MKIFFKIQKKNQLIKKLNTKFLLFNKNYFLKKKNKIYKHLFKNWRNNKKFNRWVFLKLIKCLRENIKIKVFIQKFFKKNYFLTKINFLPKINFFYFLIKKYFYNFFFLFTHFTFLFINVNNLLLLNFFIISYYLLNNCFYFRFEKNIKFSFFNFQLKKFTLILNKLKLKKYKQMFTKKQKKNILIKLKNFQLKLNTPQSKNIKIFKKINYSLKTYLITLKLFNKIKFYKKYDNIKLKKIIQLKKTNATLKNKMHIERDAIFFFNFNKFFFLKKKLNNSFTFQSNKYFNLLKIKNNTIQRTFNPRKKWFHFFKFNQNLLAYLYFFKKKRSHFLKKFYSNVLKKSLQSFFISLELNLNNILLKTKFCFTKKQVFELIKFNYIYINGIPVNSTNLVVQISDVIQILYTKFYFKKYLYTKFYFKNISFRIKHCLNRWYKHQYNFYKQRPQKLPSWLLNLVFLKIPTVTYCEIDYKTLTIVIIKQPILVSAQFSYNLRYINIFLLRQYNWRLSN